MDNHVNRVASRLVPLRRRINAGAAAIPMAFVLAISACSTPPAASRAPSASVAASAAAFGADCPATTTKVGFDAVSQTAWPVWIAHETGAFSKYGIQSEIIFTESGRSVPGILNRQTPITSSDGSAIFSPNAEGADLVAVMSTGNRPTDMIVGGREITDPQQLRGKIAGVNALTDETTALMKYALTEEFGLTPDQDVEILSVGGEDVRTAALAADRVQATVIDASLETTLVDQGFHILHNFLKGDLDWNKNVIMTTEAYAAENPKVVECFLMAMMEAVVYYKSNKQGSVDVATKYSEGMDSATLGAIWDLYSPLFPDVPKVPVAGFELMQSLNSDPRAQALDLNTLVDNSFLEKLETNGFIDSLK